jgi:hypothetical protein
MKFVVLALALFAPLTLVSAVEAQSLSAYELYELATAERCYKYPWTEPDWIRDQSTCVLGTENQAIEWLYQFYKVRYSSGGCQSDFAMATLLRAFKIATRIEPSLLGLSGYRAAVRSFERAGLCEVPK